MVPPQVVCAKACFPEEVALQDLVLELAVVELDEDDVDVPSPMVTQALICHLVRL